VNFYSKVGFQKTENEFIIKRNDVRRKTTLIRFRNYHYKYANEHVKDAIVREFSPGKPSLPFI